MYLWDSMPQGLQSLREGRVVAYPMTFLPQDFKNKLLLYASVYMKPQIIFFYIFLLNPISRHTGRHEFPDVFVLIAEFKVALRSVGYANTSRYFLYI